MMNSKLLIILSVAIINAFILSAIEKVTFADNSLFIYGKVTTIDNESYEGQIRWGKEEAFWFDMFNSTKVKNNNLKHLSDDELDMLNKHDKKEAGYFNKWFDGADWNSNVKDHIHVFACQFGDIASLMIGGDNDIVLRLKNGDTIELEGGSNDIGAAVKVNDADLGLISMDWKRIKKVEFMNTPRSLVSTFGDPLYGTVRIYGTVRTERGEFTGFLQWDHDERLSKDKLNASYVDGNLDIEFGNIKSIKKMHNGSIVTLKSGRSFEMTGSNDVNDENRGIIVNWPGSGRVDIQWDEFLDVSFSQVPSEDISYADYKGENKITGVVETSDGNNYEGRIVFDLDEEYKLEMLNGVHNKIEYFIPFSSIKTITPKNREETQVDLLDGKSYVLEDKVDVNAENDGVLVFGSNDNPQYITWKNIETIRFE